MKLKEITWDNFWDVVNLKPAKSQSKFLPANSIFMAQAYVNLKMHYRDICFSIYHNSDLIGFTKIVFVEKNEPTFNFSEDTYYIDALMIDEKHQGKGFGKLSLSEILSWIHAKPWGLVHSIKSSCYDENAAMVGLFQKFNFTKTNDFVRGRNALRIYTMERDL